jgi:N-acetylneuraminate synthase
MQKKIVIDGANIGGDYPPYVIAEMSANHNGNIETAFKIIEQAKIAGASAIKIQTYRPDTLTLNLDTKDFRITDGLWAGRTLYELYEQAHTPWDWHLKLFEHAKKIGITIFSSPFDFKAVELLEELNAPAYKIASFEAVDLELIRYVASTGKPMIISTGMANEREIHQAIDAAVSGGCMELAILHCVSSYPAPAEDYNLKTIPDMIEKFGLVTGLSDHHLGDSIAIASIAMGATIIEKHFTLDRNGGGADDSFSIEPKELESLCRNLCLVKSAMGQISYQRKASELGNVKFRRSLYAVKDIAIGEEFNLSNVKSIRPGYGLPPSLLKKVIGNFSTCNIPYGTALNLNMLKHRIDEEI